MAFAAWSSFCDTKSSANEASTVCGVIESQVLYSRSGEGFTTLLCVLEERDWIDHRSRSVRHAKRRHGEHEFPPLQLRSGFGERFEIEVVEQRHAETHERQHVERNGDAWNRAALLRRIVRSEER